MNCNPQISEGLTFPFTMCWMWNLQSECEPTQCLLDKFFNHQIYSQCVFVKNKAVASCLQLWCPSAVFSKNSVHLELMAFLLSKQEVRRCDAQWDAACWMNSVARWEPSCTTAPNPLFFYTLYCRTECNSVLCTYYSTIWLLHYNLVPNL